MSIATILPLDLWRQNIGFNPWHFWQFAHQELVPLESACNGLVYQYSWQSVDAAGRYDILEAISNAEATLATQIALGYAPAPHFKTELKPFPRYPDRTVDRLGYAQADWKWVGIHLSEGQVQALGIETREHLGTAEVTYTDDDGDGLSENWSISVPAAGVADPNQIAVYFREQDRPDKAPLSEAWRIRPVRVSIADGAVTVQGKSWLMAIPALYEIPSQLPLDPTDASNFVEEVEVYRYYCNPNGSTNDTAQVKLIWETLPHPYWCGCSGCSSGATTNSTDPAAEAYAIARGVIRNSASGLIGVGEAGYDPGTGIWHSACLSICRPPDRLEVRYQAGYPLSEGQMDKQMQRIVTRFAAAELNRPICACSFANRELNKWQYDLTRTSGNADEAYGATDQEDVNNPLGTCRGHAWAWKQIRYLRNTIGVSV